MLGKIHYQRNESLFNRDEAELDGNLTNSPRGDTKLKYRYAKLKVF